MCVLFGCEDPSPPNQSSAMSPAHATVARRQIASFSSYSATSYRNVRRFLSGVLYEHVCIYVCMCVVADECGRCSLDVISV